MATCELFRNCPLVGIVAELELFSGVNVSSQTAHKLNLRFLEAAILHSTLHKCMSGLEGRRFRVNFYGLSDLTLIDG